MKWAAIIAWTLILPWSYLSCSPGELAGPKAQDSDAGTKPKPTEPSWSQGNPELSLPAFAALEALPGGGGGHPIIQSDNPEEFYNDGLLYGTGNSPTSRGGGAYPLSGTFTVYIHHINRAQSNRYVTILATNAEAYPITVSAKGVGYTQSETGGLGLGQSPSFRVAKDWLSNRLTQVLSSNPVASNRPVIVWQKRVNPANNIEGRFEIHTSGRVFIYIVASESSAIEHVYQTAQKHAQGEIAIPRPFGRTAGVYAKDTWEGVIETQVPSSGHFRGFWVNTATGVADAKQYQAYPALTHYNDSSSEAVGMYGTFFNLKIRLHHPESDRLNRRVKISLASYGKGTPSRFWDGTALVNQELVLLRNTPDQRVDAFSTVTLAPGESKEVIFRAMVPGLSSIPQALFLESY